MLPEIRNLGGAVWVFTFSLYPYVYLLARTALAERAAHLMEAARLLGAPLSRRIREVALPLARPAVAAGVALALMETLADFGVSSYFGIQTFTAGIYKAWLAMDNRTGRRAAGHRAAGAGGAAAVAGAPGAATHAFCRRCGGRARAVPRRSRCGCGAARAALAWRCARCRSLIGFVLPVLFMLRPLVGRLGSVLPWAMFVQWSCNSVRLGGLSAVLAIALALALAFALRRRPDCAHPRRGAAGQPGLRRAGRGDRGRPAAAGGLAAGGRPESGVGYWITATVLGIVWAYLVRFTRGGAAVGAKRLRAHSGQSGRLGPHAGHHRPGAGCSGCTGRCSGAPPPPPRCWCLST